AAAALLTDYVLNAAVSLTAGVEALGSAFPGILPHRTGLALLLLLAITLVNLRGLHEAGSVMIVPVYLFLATYLFMIVYGVGVALVKGAGPVPAAMPPAVESITLLLVLRTFASGATALTGVEAISNAVPVFRPPATRHAAQTMGIMAGLMGTLFLGTIGLTQYFHVVAGPDETILSALARRLFGSGGAHLLIQVSTLLVLVVAANTSFTGFPRVTSIIARDGYMPRQLTALGDRLVFSNGIVLLAGLAGLLIVLFSGDTHRLIPLFALGAFMAFTLSQVGMVAHWFRQRDARWPLKAALNGLGALATALALLVIGFSKFIHGAWIIVILLPLLVLGFRHIRAHYDEVGRQLSLADDPVMPVPVTMASVAPHPRVVIPVAGVHRGMIAAVQYARSISDDVTAVYIEMDPAGGEALREKWRRYGLDRLATLVVVSSPYCSVIAPFLDYLDAADRTAADGQLATVVIPEFVPARWWHHLLHNQTAWVLKLVMLYRRHKLGRSRVIIDVPFHLYR
ncbi:MAG: APC family permease, partial [Anaerolineae bacterium]|nr:APC family permease [Anaerolineae bacterium]